MWGPGEAYIKDGVLFEEVKRMVSEKEGLEVWTCSWDEYWMERKWLEMCIRDQSSGSELRRA